LSENYPEGNDADFKRKWHHAALAYKSGQIKCYVDQYRVLVIPQCGFMPQAVLFGGIGSKVTPVCFTNVRITTGGNMNMLGKLLTNGKFVTHAITFDVNRSTIKPESMGFLNQLTKFLKENPSVKLEIDGYTDNDGDEAANLKLSQDRADGVKKQLVILGTDTSRLTTKGFGETKPVDTNTTPEGKANNRRVEFVKK
jgi:outer membrane protein OmpA-like peptidoglycan-associated protein